MIKFFLNLQFFKFLLVGVLNTLFGYGIFALLIFFKMHYTLAMLFATCLGVLFNFKTIGGLVFNNTNHRLLWKFFIIYLLVYLITIVVIKLLLLFTSNNLYINGAIATIISAIISFSLNKKYVFQDNSKSQNALNNKGAN